VSSAIKNIHDSWEEVKILTLTGVWKKLSPTVMDYFERSKDSVEEVTADVLEIENELELLLFIETVNGFLPSSSGFL
jgi:hypothetical protein